MNRGFKNNEKPYVIIQKTSTNVLIQVSLKLLSRFKIFQFVSNFYQPPWSGNKQCAL